MLHWTVQLPAGEFTRKWSSQKGLGEKKICTHNGCNFSQFDESINLNIQEAQWTLSARLMKETTPKHVITMKKIKSEKQPKGMKESNIHRKRDSNEGKFSSQMYKWDNSRERSLKY